MLYPLSYERTLRLTPILYLKIEPTFEPELVVFGPLHRIKKTHYKVELPLCSSPQKPCDQGYQTSQASELNRSQANEVTSYGATLLAGWLLGSTRVEECPECFTSGGPASPSVEGIAPESSDALDSGSICILAIL